MNSSSAGSLSSNTTVEGLDAHTQSEEELADLAVVISDDDEADEEDLSVSCHDDAVAFSQEPLDEDEAEGLLEESKPLSGSGGGCGEAAAQDTNDGQDQLLFPDTQPDSMAFLTETAADVEAAPVAMVSDEENCEGGQVKAEKTANKVRAIRIFLWMVLTVRAP